MIRKNWLLVPLLIIGFYYNLWRIQNADTEMVFQEFIYGFLILLFLIFLAFSINKDFKKFKISKSWTSYFPTFVGFLILVSFGINALVLNMRDHSPIILHAGYDGDFNGAWFEFREDGTYKFIEYASVGADITRGSYQLKDSIIILDKNEIGNIIISNTLVIREENYAGSKSKVLYQIDKNHIIVNPNFKFLVSDKIED